MAGSFKGGSGQSPPTLVYEELEGMDQWVLAVTSDPAAKGSARDWEVAGAGLGHCHFPSPSFLTKRSSRDIVFQLKWQSAMK